MPDGLQCPDAERLQRFVLGQLPAGEVATLAEHVESCARCVGMLHGLSTSDGLVAAMQQLPAGPGAADAKLIEQFCALGTPAFHGSTGVLPSAHGGLLDRLAEPPADSTQELYDFLAPPQSSDELGRLGPYRVLRVLGAGGMGVVFDAEDTDLKRPVALKVLRPTLATSASARRRFLREGQAAAALNHDRIVPIYQVGEDRGIPFLAMPLLEGETLEDRLRRAAPLPAAEVLRIGREIAEGLAVAHARGLIHRDIKPSNVFLQGMVSGESGVVDQAGADSTPSTGIASLPTPHSRLPRLMLLDFGLARAVGGDAHLTQSGVVVGTPAYMAPEQARGDAVDQRADLFSLGCVLYRATTGQVPFPGRNALETLLALARHDPPSPARANPRLPPGLPELIMKLLAREPADRFATAQAVVEALDAIAAGRPLAVRSGPRWGRRAGVALTAAVLLGVAAFTVYVLRPEDAPATDAPPDGAALFAPAVHTSAGLYPCAVAVADFDGDGKADLVIANSSPHSVSVLPGNGDGSFRPPLTMTVGDWFVYTLATADLNGDGKPDLVVVADDICVLLGKGDGTFQPPIPYAAGEKVQGVAVADFNGDGKPDLAVANREGTISILLGKGDGTFLDARTVPAATECSAVVVGDFNRDGKPDLAVLDPKGNRIGVLRGQGDGTFDAVAFLTLGPSVQPLALTVLDANGDGKFDLAVAATMGAAVLLGNGDGTFQDAVLFEADVSHAIVAADLNGDGWPDLALANEGSTQMPGHTITVLLNNGDGSFGKPLTYAVGSSPRALAAGDFNSDGAPDLAVVNLNSNTVSILLHQPPRAYRAHLGPATDYALGGEPHAVVVGDFDRDGMDDVAVADYGGAALHVLRGRGDGTFAAADRCAAGKGPTAVTAADFNRDGHLDVAVANARDDTVSVLLGAGDATFQGAVAYAVGKKPMGIAVADFNADGKPDLVTADYEGGTVSVLLGKGDGAFHEAVRCPCGKQARCVAVADVNGDGRADLVVANSLQAGTVQVLFGKGDGTFAAPLPCPVGSFPIAVAVGDFNRDGKLDLAVANWGGSDIGVLLGNGDGTFRTAVNYGVSRANPFAIATADIDGDGKLDLVVAMGGDTSVVRVMRGHGDGTFATAPYQFNAGLDPRGLALGRFRRNGRPDVVTANAHSGNVSVLLNRPAAPYLSTEFWCKAIDHSAMTCELALRAHQAEDPWTTTDTGYTGTVHLHSTDSRAELPTEYTFVPQERGFHLLTVTFRSPGNQTVTITDADGKLRSAAVTVRVHTTADIHYNLDAPTAVEAGKPFTVTVNVMNQFNRWIDGYDGTVEFRCTDPAATLPPAYRFNRANVHVFRNAFTLQTPGQWLITASDPAVPGLVASTKITVRTASAGGKD